MPRIAAGLKASASPSRRPAPFCTMSRAITWAVLAPRSSQPLSGMNMVAALVLLPPPIRSKPMMPMVACTPGFAITSLVISSDIRRVRSSVAPSGSWIEPKM